MKLFWCFFIYNFFNDENYFILVNGTWQPVTQASTTCGFTLEVGGRLILTAPYTNNCWHVEVILRLWACMLTS